MSLIEAQSRERGEEIASFLRTAGWDDAALRWMAQDASTRRYARLLRGERSAVLMDAPPRAESPPCPAGADPEERKRLGENALRRLAASRVEAFWALSAYLRRLDLSAPEVIAGDVDKGLLLLEDLGDDLLAVAVARGEDEAALYGRAGLLLAKLHDARPPAELKAGAALWPLQAYDRTAFAADLAIFPEWAAPSVRDKPEAMAEWGEVWTRLAGRISEPEKVLMLRDFHAENLMWLPGRGSGPESLGLLDFQDAVIGPAAADLVYLLDDARRDVSPAARRAALDRYAAEAGLADRPAFEADMAILAAHFGARLLGLFERLPRRDGKTRYLAFTPRVRRHFREALRHEANAELRCWVERWTPQFGPAAGDAR